jgi:hypothetical protein
MTDPRTPLDGSLPGEPSYYERIRQGSGEQER